MNSAAEPFLPTRRSLLTRLKCWDNHDAWREFFETYWRLIYGVAKRSGLNDAESQDVVQETILSVAKEMPGFKYNRAQGSFKSWLRLITRRRIVDQWRKRLRAAEVGVAESLDIERSPMLEQLVDPSSDALDSVWNEEWQSQIRATALERVKRSVKDEHFQIFELLIVRGWTARKVAQYLGVSLALVYWARHQVSDSLKRELKRMNNELA